MEPKQNKEGLMYLVLDGMSPNVKATLFAFLAVPIFLAISGILLQINVGVIVETIIEDTRQVRKDEHALKMVAANFKAESVDKAITKRLIEVDQLIVWSCNHGRKENRPKFCKDK